VSDEESLASERVRFAFERVQAAGHRTSFRKKDKSRGRLGCGIGRIVPQASCFEQALKETQEHIRAVFCESAAR
jgi:hypothetical protein